MLRPNLNLNHTKMCARTLTIMFVLEVTLRLRQMQLPPLRGQQQVLLMGLMLASNVKQLNLLKTSPPPTLNPKFDPRQDLKWRLVQESTKFSHQHKARKWWNPRDSLTARQMSRASM